MEATYEAVDLQAMVNELTELTKIEQNQLLATLQRYPELFQGGLGTLNIKPIHLELIDGAKPFHAKPFPVPQAYTLPTKKELVRLITKGVFEANHESEWAAPTFIQPKPTGGIRILTDFRKLNEQLKRKTHPLPKIQDIPKKLSGFNNVTTLNLNMGY